MLPHSTYIGHLGPPLGLAWSPGLVVGPDLAWGGLLLGLAWI